MTDSRYTNPKLSADHDSGILRTDFALQVRTTRGSKLLSRYVTTPYVRILGIGRRGIGLQIHAAAVFRPSLLRTLYGYGIGDDLRFKDS